MFFVLYSLLITIFFNFIMLIFPVLDWRLVLFSNLSSGHLFFLSVLIIVYSGYFECKYSVAALAFNLLLFPIFIACNPPLFL